jgi:hypothetical protein
MKALTWNFVTRANDGWRELINNQIRKIKVKETMFVLKRLCYLLTVAYFSTKKHKRLLEKYQGNQIKKSRFVKLLINVIG